MFLNFFFTKAKLYLVKILCIFNVNANREREPIKVPIFAEKRKKIPSPNRTLEKTAISEVGWGKFMVVAQNTFGGFFLSGECTKPFGRFTVITPYLSASICFNRRMFNMTAFKSPTMSERRTQMGA